MKIESIESRFKEVTQLDADFSIWPHTEVYRQVRRTEFKDKGEVFTPTVLVDKMIEIAKPKPNEVNLDMCSGQGQFTVRMLRYFYNQDSNFNCESYLKENHWFNEINEVNVESLKYIFGENINILIGDARMIKHMKTDETGKPLKGIWYFKNNNWSINKISKGLF